MARSHSTVSSASQSMRQRMHFTRAYKSLLEGLGLTYPQYLVMLVLWERGEILVKTIGEALDLDSGTLSPLLKRLEPAGLVQRLRDVRDERKVLVRLTDKGAEMKEQAGAVVKAIGTATGCKTEEVAALRDSLHALRTNLATAG